MTARAETMALYRSFLRLRHEFPSKQGRSVLKRWTQMFFSLRQVEFDKINYEKGPDAAREQSKEWRKDAHDDFRTFRPLSLISYSISIIFVVLLTT